MPTTRRRRCPMYEGGDFFFYIFIVIVLLWWRLLWLVQRTDLLPALTRPNCTSYLSMDVLGIPRTVSKLPESSGVYFTRLPHHPSMWDSGWQIVDGQSVFTECVSSLLYCNRLYCMSPDWFLLIFVIFQHLAQSLKYNRYWKV